MKFWQRFDKVRKSKMAAMKIQDGRYENPRWRLSDVCDATAEVW